MNEIKIYGENQTLKPSQKWHDAIRNCPGQYYAYNENIFITDRIEIPDNFIGFFYISFLSVYKNANFANYPPGIYLATTTTHEQLNQLERQPFNKVISKISEILASNRNNPTLIDIRDTLELTDKRLPDSLIDISLIFKTTECDTILNETNQKINKNQIFELTPATLQETIKTLNPSYESPQKPFFLNN